MKKIFLTLILVMVGSFSSVSQEKEPEKALKPQPEEQKSRIPNRIFELEKAIDSVTISEKKLLKEAIILIDEKLDNQEITLKEAEEMKLNEARKTSLSIEEKTKIYKQEKQELLKESQDTISVVVKLPIKEKKIYGSWSYERKYSAKRTQRLGLYMALAFHNLNSSENFSNDAFRNWGSKSFEIGYQMNTRLLKNHNLLHLNYGLTFMIDKLKMREDNYFVNNAGVVTIEPFGHPTRVSKFKTNYLTLPIELEFDFSSPYNKKEGKNYYPVHNSFRFGFGGFIGVLTGNRQKVKYTIGDESHRHLDRGHFGLNQWIYGVSAHIGYKRTAFYVKYTLTPLFNNNPIKEYPFSVGIRFLE